MMGQAIDQQLALLYLASPTLPIGSFAYSQGLEKAIELDVVSDQISLQAWCQDMLRFGLAELDLPMLSRLHAAFTEGDIAKLAGLNDEVMAMRETEELLKEECNLGSSLNRLLVTQNLCLTLASQPSQRSFLYSFAHAAVALQMNTQQMQLGFLWSWLENQTAVACKAIPLGQSDAQAILLALRPLICELLDNQQGSDADHALYGSLPGQALLSALHETQYSRLFRS